MELVTRGVPCLRLFNSAEKEEAKVYEILADAFCVMQARAPGPRLSCAHLSSQ